MTLSGQEKMEKIVSLAKQRGFIYQGSDIYGGLAGMWDYGPMGVALRNNIKKLWWNMFVDRRTDIYGIDASILMNEKVWQASGHIEGFSDPLVEDVKTKERYRADHLLEDAGVNVTGMSIDDMAVILKEKNIKSPKGNDLSTPRAFNMMFETQVGATEPAQTSYLRPETAQGIFTNYKNILDSFHPKIPFGIAQIGKAFRNEIAPRDFIFRLRELEAMEIEWFTHESEWEMWFDHFKDALWEWVNVIGLTPEKVSEYETPDAELAHYSKRTVDFEYDYPFGKKELYGLAYRTDHDLKKHQECSKVDLTYFDQASGEHFLPHVIEPALGVDRTVLAILCDAYAEEELPDGEIRTVFRFVPAVAPITVAVLPLMRKDELKNKANEIFKELIDQNIRTLYDETGSIGKRYRRQDEIGTPYAVTIDYETLEDKAVTVRDRDTMEQIRIPIEELPSFIHKKLRK
jgi:glycyl-tRNA synthetase